MIKMWTFKDDNVHTTDRCLEVLLVFMVIAFCSVYHHMQIVFNYDI